DSEGVCCLRFQDERDKERAKSHLENLKIYPFHVYDVVNRHWQGTTPKDAQPVQVLPLTTEYSQEVPEPGSVLVLRTALGLSQTTLAPFRQYGTPDAPVRFVYSRFYAHDHWVWEYYIQFPSVEEANLALKNHAGEKITVPYASLSTVDKVRHPYGKSQHIWLRHTGLEKLPRVWVKPTELYNLIYNRRGADRKELARRSDQEVDISGQDRA
ncbi:hypothetical protein M408DRAFT_91468, partial [Serendipita vermifera MAFF 305830]